MGQGEKRKIKNKQLPAATDEKSIANMPENSARLPPKLSNVEGKHNAISLNENDLDKLFKAIGTHDLELASHFFRQLNNISIFTDQSHVDRLNTALALLHGIKPHDALEALLAVQMIGVHNLAMDFMARSILKEQTFEGCDANVNWAMKLLRTFTAQIEALNRYRSQGQQKVVVEHVHVNQGGQAIVGTIEGGGGKHGKCG